MHIRITIAALVALGCAGSPEDAFVGAYSGSQECLGSFDDGSPYTDGPTAATISIERASDGSVFIAGQGCTFPLSVIGPTRADVLPASCNITLNDGTPATFTNVSGVVALDEPDIHYTVQNVIEAADWTLSSSCTFDGTRVE